MAVVGRRRRASSSPLASRREAAGASHPRRREARTQRPSYRQPARYVAPINTTTSRSPARVLAHFLNLGTETGSWALGSTFADFFTESLNAVAGTSPTSPAAVIETSSTSTGGRTSPRRASWLKPIGHEHPLYAEAIRALVDCGALTVDDTLEPHLRALLRPARPRHPEETPQRPRWQHDDRHCPPGLVLNSTRAAAADGTRRRRTCTSTTERSATACGARRHARNLVAQLAELDAETIRCAHQLPGGAAWDGITILNALRRHDARIEVIVAGLAGSAASVIAMAGDHSTSTAARR